MDNSHVALVALLWPWAVALYFVVTIPMTGGASRRLEELEVSW